MVGNVCENIAPWLRIPESHSPLGEPGVPEVLLWPLELQVHLTVSPGWIVTDEGEKLKPPLPTITVTVAAGATAGKKASSAARVNASSAAPLLRDAACFPLALGFVGCAGSLLISYVGRSARFFIGSGARLGKDGKVTTL